MKKRIIYFLLLQLNFLFINGQPGMYFMPDYDRPRPYEHYPKGYIIIKTDTIHCYVKNKSLNKRNIKYKLTADSKLQKIQIDDIVEVYNNAFVFEKINYEHRCFLLKRLIMGPVSLYENAASIGPSFPDESIFFLKKSDKFVKIKRESYNKDIKNVLTDNPEIIKKIEALMYEDMDVYIQAFVNNYNEWLKNKDKEVQ